MDKNVFKSVEKLTTLSIVAANKIIMSTNTFGDIDLVVNVHDKPSTIKINNVYYVPEPRVNLLLVSQILNKENTVVFNSKGA